MLQERGEKQRERERGSMAMAMDGRGETPAECSHTGLGGEEGGETSGVLNARHFPAPRNLSIL